MSAKKKKVASSKKKTARRKRSPKKQKSDKRSDPLWLDFEQDVARIYESLGYMVKHNIEVAGQQVDLTATKIIPGIGEIRLAVECKHTKTSRNVSNQNVFDFISFINAVHMTADITTGIMVANTGFSVKAKTAAENSTRVKLLTKEEIEHDIFDVHNILSAFIYNYKNSAIFHNYIPLSADTNAATLELTHGSMANAERDIMNWIRSSTPGFISILGDYGAGKTTLVERIKFNLSEQYIARRSPPTMKCLPQ